MNFFNFYDFYSRSLHLASNFSIADDRFLLVCTSSLLLSASFVLTLSELSEWCTLEGHKQGIMKSFVLVKSVLEEGNLIFQIALLEHPVIVLIHHFSLPIVLCRQRLYLLLIDFVKLCRLVDLLLLLSQLTP